MTRGLCTATIIECGDVRTEILGSRRGTSTQSRGSTACLLIQDRTLLPLRRIRHHRVALSVVRGSHLVVGLWSG